MLVAIIIWLLIGAVCGWLAGLVMRSGGGLLTNIVVGIVGAVIAGLLFGPNINSGSPLSVTNFVYSLLGAIILLAIVNLIQRGRVR